jgi:ABC-type bacteriocin/lantibiotic exporter with double-glycine peptidase domain
LKPVIQQEKTGCGIASVAALAGVSYAHARVVANRLGIYAEDPQLWSDTSYVRSLLRKFGITASRTEQKFISWNKLPDLALLATKWHRENVTPFWHWVVFVREGGQCYVLDSRKALKTNRRTDFGRIKPKWFIKVHDNTCRV